jgi:hypothetical protein
VAFLWIDEPGHPGMSPFGAEVVTLPPQWLAIYARQSSCYELPLQCVNSSDAVLAAIPPLELEEKQIANSL